MSISRQGARVLDYIATHGTISPMEAWNHLGITKLATRISELKKEGYTFRQERVSTKNRFSEKVNYMRYSMDDGMQKSDQVVGLDR